MTVAPDIGVLLQKVAGLVLVGARVTKDTIDVRDKTKGAYILILQLDVSVRAEIPSLKYPTLLPGWYYYAGNANGPGGIHARLKRHFSKHKKPHWHIDYLTNACRSIEALTFVDTSECDLVRRLTQTENISAPVRKFGSSDCQQCESHLLMHDGSQ